MVERATKMFIDTRAYAGQTARYKHDARVDMRRPRQKTMSGFISNVAAINQNSVDRSKFAGHHNRTLLGQIADKDRDIIILRQRFEARIAASKAAASARNVANRAFKAAVTFVKLARAVTQNLRELAKGDSVIVDGKHGFLVRKAQQLVAGAGDNWLVKFDDFSVQPVGAIHIARVASSKGAGKKKFAGIMNHIGSSGLHNNNTSVVGDAQTTAAVEPTAVVDNVSAATSSFGLDNPFQRRVVMGMTQDYEDADTGHAGHPFVRVRGSGAPQTFSGNTIKGSDSLRQAMSPEERSSVPKAIASRRTRGFKDIEFNSNDFRAITACDSSSWAGTRGSHDEPSNTKEQHRKSRSGLSEQSISPSTTSISTGMSGGTFGFSLRTHNLKRVQRPTRATRVIRAPPTLFQSNFQYGSKCTTFLPPVSACKSSRLGPDPYGTQGTRDQYGRPKKCVMNVYSHEKRSPKMNDPKCREFLSQNGTLRQTPEPTFRRTRRPSFSLRNPYVMFFSNRLELGN